MNEKIFYPKWIEKYRADTLELSDCIEKIDYKYKNEVSSIYLCRPWPSVTVWANNVFMEKLPVKIEERPYPFIKINYCTKGRCELTLENEKSLYISDGMLSIDSNKAKEMFRYPTKEYEGLEIVINLNELKKHPLAVLDDLGIGAGRLQKFTKGNDGSFISGVSPQWHAYAEEMIKKLENGEGKIEDYRFYLIRLLYMLNKGGIKPVKTSYVTKGQKRIADEAEKYISENIKNTYTIAYLASKAGISTSSLKKYFTMVYGVSISEYARKKRMEHACILLEETDLSIMEIAKSTSYSHQGKFGAVFKKYTGLTPVEYRRQNRTMK